MRAKLPSIDEELMEKGTFRCNGRRSCQICPLMREGDSFHNFDSTRSFKNFSGRYNSNSDHVVYLLQCESCNKKYVGSTKTKFRQRFNVYKSYCPAPKRGLCRTTHVKRIKDAVSSKSREISAGFPSENKSEKLVFLEFSNTSLKWPIMLHVIQ